MFKTYVYKFTWLGLSRNLKDGFLYMRYLLLICLLFSFAKVNVAQLRKSDLQEEARKKIQNKDFLGAIGVYSTLLNMDSMDASSYVNRARCYYELKKLKECFYDCSQAISVDPFYSRSYFYRARIFTHSGDHYEALKDLNLALKYAEHDSLRMRYLHARASANAKLRNFKTAETDFYTLFVQDSNRIEIMNDYAMILSENGRNDLAVYYFQKITKLDSGLALGFANLGYYLLKQLNYKEAIIALNRALKLDPTFAYAYNNRGYARLMTGDLEGAFSDINTSIRYEKANSYAYRNLGLYYLKTNKKKEACIEFHKAIKLGFRDKFGEEVDNFLKIHCE